MTADPVDDSVESESLVDLAQFHEFHAMVFWLAGTAISSGLHFPHPNRPGTGTLASTSFDSFEDRRDFPDVALTSATMQNQIDVRIDETPLGSRESDAFIESLREPRRQIWLEKSRRNLAARTRTVGQPADVKGK